MRRLTTQPLHPRCVRIRASHQCFSFDSRRDGELSHPGAMRLWWNTAVDSSLLYSPSLPLRTPCRCRLGIAYTKWNRNTAEISNMEKRNVCGGRYDLSDCGSESLLRGADGRYLGSRIPTWSDGLVRSTYFPFPRLAVAYSPPLLTIDSNLQTVSVGWAPTPIQYFALVMSSLMSLCSLPEVS